MSDESQPSEPQNENAHNTPFHSHVSPTEESGPRDLYSPVDPSAKPTFPHSWNVLVSWLVIIGVVAFQLAMHQIKSDPDADESENTVPIMDVQFEAKMALFLESIEPKPDNDDEQRPKSSQAKDIVANSKGGSVQSRLARAIMLAYFDDHAGAAEALDNLDRAIEENGYTPTNTQERLLRITRKLLGSSEPEISDVEPNDDGDSIKDGSADSETVAIKSDAAGNDETGDQISADDKKFFVEQFGWIGELGLLLRDNEREGVRQRIIGGATRALIGLIVLGGVGFLWGLAGLVAGGLFAIWVFTKGFFSRIEGQRQRSAVYLETFAIWMMVLVGSQIVVALVAKVLSGKDGSQAEVISWAMHIMPIAFLGSLAVLVWPVLRGISVGDMRRDIGWYGNPIVESFWGLCGHVASFLFLLAAFFVTIGVVALLNSLKPATDELAGVETMGHPIQEAMSGSSSLIFAVFFLTVVCAPIVEETFFRGVFYRYLRDVWQGGSLVFKIGFAALLNSFIFAVIHPQGIAGVPILTALAIVLSLIRENRGSLWGSMAVHAAHNFFVTMMAFMVLS